MSTKKKLIPFKLFPAAWGLAGKSFERAKAEYELDGDDLIIKLAEIEYGIESKEVFKAKLLIDLNAKKISQYEYELATVRSEQLPEAIIAEKILEIEHNHNKISDKEWEKRKHTLEGKPWVDIITGLDPENAAKLGEVELDWNDLFIVELKKQGYNGTVDEVIIKKWFAALCATIAMEGGFVSPPPTVPLAKDLRDKPDNTNFREYE